MITAQDVSDCGENTKRPNEHQSEETGWKWVSVKTLAAQGRRGIGLRRNKAVLAAGEHVQRH